MITIEKVIYLQAKSTKRCKKQNTTETRGKKFNFKREPKLKTGMRNFHNQLNVTKF